jgi:CHASE3 domain sensor protein
MSFLSRLRGSVIAFPLAALAALAMLAISEASYQDATSSLDRLGERNTARIKLNDLVKSLLDAETGQRGYLLTERREYLRPYEQAQKESRGLLAWLSDYYAKDPKTAPTMREMAKETEAKLSELATTIDLHDRGVENAWRELMLSDIGREKMEHVRKLGERLIEHETAEVEVGRRSVYQTLWLNRIGVSAMAAVSLLALFMYLRQTATLDRALADEAERMASERDRLEQEVAARTTQLKEPCRSCHRPLERLWQVCPYCATSIERRPPAADLDAALTAEALLHPNGNGKSPPAPRRRRTPSR